MSRHAIYLAAAAFATTLCGCMEFISDIATPGTPAHETTTTVLKAVAASGNAAGFAVGAAGIAALAVLGFFFGRKK